MKQYTYTIKRCKSSPATKKIDTGGSPEAVEVRHDVLARAMVHDLALSHKEDVVEQLVRLKHKRSGVAAGATPGDFRHYIQQAKLDRQISLLDHERLSVVVGNAGERKTARP